ncbi:Oligoribonuclease A [Anaerovibrio sp. JC8]|uniref:DHH family phosphoesterase n=1 Tax=Anaerovibrio sp. JC8 TaxID=1240085 RepID=UPI000A0EC294|nr:bifunctional oligoribonuclease/PAP phosphatase NrnA [Anaerovibrio sp. JC8]ORU00240.1 Oligoribonuclease A [Anaerovibrio sp. JC8]
MIISLKETADRLMAAKSLVLTAHVNPDGDAIGSCLGLKFMLEKLGKKVRVLIDDDLPKFLGVLPGIDTIEKPEAESYEADYLVILDASLDRVGTVIEKCKAPTLNIDHHRTNDEKADYLCLDAKSAATCEIIFELGKELGVEFDINSATPIYTGLATDSGYFRYSNTTPHTMRAAAELLETGIRPEMISEAIETKDFAVVQGMARALQTIELHADGRVAGLFLDNELTESLETTEGFIDHVRVIDGVDVAVLLKAVEPEVCRVSMRSKKTDVANIAVGLGGGGHIRAAGCTIEKPFAQAKAEILKEIEKSLAE